VHVNDSFLHDCIHVHRDYVLIQLGYRYCNLMLERSLPGNPQNVQTIRILGVVD
jgi:hypothetical protein